ncbi:MAG: DUF2141 domain-containing protein [Bacteroidales bacterium]|jgi:uncharacterized protein (DUF2141 family)|nr:DUF2141 domain-containing protein [Bacteroidales bacterium]
MPFAKIFSITLLLIVPMAGELCGQNIEVTVTGIRSSEGQLVLGVFTSDEAFHSEESVLEKREPKSGMKDGSIIINITLEPGVYGISVLDDEDSDAEMEFNFLGIPKEGFGFSDYYHTGFTKPKFDLYKFTVTKDKPLKLNVRMRYIL